MTLLPLLLLSFGCIGSEPREHARDAHGHEDEHEGEDDVAHAAAGELVVAPDVLRDLRITTGAASTTAGDERATVLGELTVDEDRYAEIGAPVSARVRALVASPGDTVEAGTPLVELESSELGRARADLATARARTDQARRSVERKRELEGGAVSARELDAAEADLAAAQADLTAAESIVAAFGAGASAVGGTAFVLRAPIAGVVLTRDAHRGEIVDPAHVLFRVADLAHLWLVVHAFERDALRAREGAVAEVMFAALPNRTFTGAVTRVGREVDPTSRTVPLRIELDNADGVLRPGMSATVRLPLGTGEGHVTVPAIAVQRCDAGWCVFVPKDPGHFEVRSVGRGRELGSDVEILSGLSAGEEVVVDGAFLLRAEAKKQAGGGDEHHH
jgi:cobalt-zinc-cadmium efflux system membrane fusion protein